MNPRGWLRNALRSKTTHAYSVLTALVLVASAAVASVVVGYNTESNTAFEVKQPPVVWQAGPDSSGNNFVSSWSLSSNFTHFNVTLKPVPEANITWQNLTTLKSNDTAAYAVTVTGSSLNSNAYVTYAALQFYGYGNNTLMGTLDLKSISPTTGAMYMSATDQYYVKTYVQLADGAGANNLPTSFGVTLGIVPV